MVDGSSSVEIGTMWCMVHFNVILSMHSVRGLKIETASHTGSPMDFDRGGTKFWLSLEV